MRSSSSPNHLWNLCTVDLDEALQCYKVAMKDPEIHRDKVRYFEIVMMNIRLGRHQVVTSFTFLVLLVNSFSLLC